MSDLKRFSVCSISTTPKGTILHLSDGRLLQVCRVSPKRSKIRLMHRNPPVEKWKAKLEHWHAIDAPFVSPDGLWTVFQ